MALEPSVVNISDLNKLWPLGADPASISDDNHRNIKTALLNDFAGFTGAVLVTGVDGGAADVYTLTPVNAVVAYTAKMLILFTPTATNLTTSPTINISGLGAKSLKDVAGNAPLSGDFVSGRPYLGEYDGTNVRMMAITKNYADQLAMSAILPAQPGGPSRYNLTSLAGSALWSLSLMDSRSISGTSSITIADVGNLVEITSGTFSLSFDPVATLGDQSTGFIYNSGPGDITLDPNGAETIDGLANFVMYEGEIRRWFVDGAAIRTLVLKNFCIKDRLTNFTYIHPPGYAFVLPDMLGGAGGGASGSRNAAGSDRSGGSGGGGGARPQFAPIYGIAPGTSISVTVGQGGAGGAAVTANSTNGNPGIAGTNTSFGSYMASYGGGAGGNINAAIAGGTGGGSGSAGTSATSTNSGGGLPRSTYFGSSTDSAAVNNISGGGGGCVAGVPGSAEYGGAAGGALNAAGNAGGVGASSIMAGPGGGGGGSISAANTGTAGNAGGSMGYTLAGGGGAGGANTGANGSAGTISLNGVGTGGGGGGANSAGAGGSGGNGALGAGGGGGGASLNGFNSGAGGNGGNGKFSLSSG